MCTALFAFGIHPRLLFFLAFNRDEFLDRPTAPAHWWEDAPDILAGLDEVRGGTWLALSRAGRFAFLTNYREAQHSTTSASRGALVTNFVRGSAPPLQYLEAIDMQAQHNGFNLVVGDLAAGQVAYATNRDPAHLRPRLLPPGLYGLSNGVLGAERGWGKVTRGKQGLQKLLARPGLAREAFPLQEVLDGLLLRGEKEADAAQLPGSGYGEAVDRELSSILVQPMRFLEGAAYGTRSQTVVAGWAGGCLDFWERTLQPPGQAGMRAFSLALPLGWEAPAAAAQRAA